MKLRNLILAIKDQGPFTRFMRNLWKGHFWGLLHKNSCIRQDTGKPKVAYNNDAFRETAERTNLNAIMKLSDELKRQRYEQNQKANS